MSDRDTRHQYNIKQTTDENIGKYQSVDYQLTQYQFLQTNILRIVQQTVRRITNEIFRVNGFIYRPLYQCVVKP